MARNSQTAVLRRINQGHKDAPDSKCDPPCQVIKEDSFIFWHIQARLHLKDGVDINPGVGVVLGHLAVTVAGRPDHVQEGGDQS